MKKNSTVIIILMALMVLCVPLAYVCVIGLFLYNLYKKNYSTIRIIKDNKGLLCVLGCGVLTILFSKYKLISSFFGMMIFACVLTISTVYVNYKEIDKKQLIKTIYIIALITYAIGLYQEFSPLYVMPIKWVDQGEYNIKRRIYSSFFNPNVFGFYINIIIICIISNMKSYRICNRFDVLEKITLVLSFICLYLTFSRTAWISLLIALMCVALLNKKYWKYFFIVFIVLFLSDKLLGVNRTDISRAVQDNSLCYRLEIWKTSLRIIKDNFIFGIGFGTFFKYTPLYSSIVVKYIEHCHNIYLQIMLDTGIVGFTIFIVMLVKTLIKISLAYIENKSNNVNSFMLMVICMTMVHGLVDSVSLTPQILIILSGIVGYALAYYKGASQNSLKDNKIKA